MNITLIRKDPLANLALGSSFEKEYSFFKYKREKFPDNLNDREMLLLLISSYHFQLFDLAFVLDIEPANKPMLDYYNQVRNDLARLTSEYENTYGLLSHTSDANASTYNYLAKPWTGDSHVDL